jgi:segregation and condensation protein B
MSKTESIESTGDDSEPRDESEKLSREQIKSRIEAALYVSSEPLSAADLSEFFEVDGTELRSVIKKLKDEYDRDGGGLQLINVAGGFKMTTREKHYSFLKKLFGQRTVDRLSDAALESLVIVAYHQPLTRGELESIRGVNCQSVLETLMEKNFVGIKGRRDEIGRPIEYGTTQKFLDYFGMNTINDLPDEEEIESLLSE